MKIEKSISELVKTNYVPVEESKEGLLRGGFGEIFTESNDVRVLNNCTCNGNNCLCKGGKDNCNCPNGTCNAPRDNCICGTSTPKAKGGLEFLL